MSDQALLNSFATDIDTASQLLELLEREFDALRERDLPRLQGLLEEKQPLLLALQQHADERAQCLLAAGVSADAAGLNQLADKSPLGEQLIGTSQTLAQHLQLLQDANLRNGRLIHTNQHAVRSALNVLRGQETPSLYDSRGGASKVTRNRPLSQA